jgi:hypothetical protein
LAAPVFGVAELREQFYALPSAPSNDSAAYSAYAVKILRRAPKPGLSAIKPAHAGTKKPKRWGLGEETLADHAAAVKSLVER